MRCGFLHEWRCKMDCTMARATGLFARDCRVIFCGAQSEKRCDRCSDWDFRVVAARVCGWLVEKAGSPDHNRAIRLHAKSSLFGQRGFSSRDGLGDAFVDLGFDSCRILRCRVLRCDAKGGKRTARPFW